MKNKITITLAATMFAAVFTTTTFAQENKKAAKARKDVAASNQDLKEAKADSAADFEQFKKDAQIKITENKKKIADLKIKKANDNQDVKVKYDAKVLALEKKNNALQDKIDGCEKTKTSMWSDFKKEFNRDMDELGDAIYDFGVDSKKP